MTLVEIPYVSTKLPVQRWYNFILAYQLCLSRKEAEKIA